IERRAAGAAGEACPEAIDRERLVPRLGRPPPGGLAQRRARRGYVDADRVARARLAGCGGHAHLASLKTRRMPWRDAIVSWFAFSLRTSAGCSKLPTAPAITGRSGSPSMWKMTTSVLTCRPWAKP